MKLDSTHYKLACREFHRVGSVGEEIGSRIARASVLAILARSHAAPESHTREVRYLLGLGDSIDSSSVAKASLRRGAKNLSYSVAASCTGYAGDFSLSDATLSEFRASNSDVKASE